MTSHAPHNHPTFVAGRARLARLVKLLLAQNDLSHQDLESLARWAAIDEEAGDWLSKSQISTLRNAKLPKPGAQLFLALACVNQRLAELTLPSRQRPTRPPLPPELRHLAVEPGPWFLINPTTGQPCGVGDLFEIYCGLLQVPELEGAEPAKLSEHMVSSACERLALLAQGWIRDQQLNSWREGKERLLQLYPPASPERRARIWAVILQEQELSPEEFVQEQDALRFWWVVCREGKRWPFGRGIAGWLAPLKQDGRLPILNHQPLTKQGLELCRPGGHPLTIRRSFNDQPHGFPIVHLYH